MPPPAAWTDAYLGVGANLGDRRAQIDQALVQLDAQAGVSVERVSSAYESEAHRRAGQEAVPAFINGVVHIRTALSAHALLRATQALEEQAGRSASAPRWAPRPLDIDLLMVGTETARTERLTLPHPRVHERRFVLMPWAELAPNLWVPDPFDATVQNLLQTCSDTHALHRRSGPLARSLFPT
ncbi:2-amino-4-hydroxy-6-hydroxymethyldihydropteridine diphosphokinase [Longimonas halophila]|uniref:2-amino-4-hydroxy-6-hydroxymethyldihydropteridine pyrophosphokinase n=1 Tax=Longimonas halophila TaxID=1469170 RepID=A0A2H3NL95_9BACT|nr:2-amino-4-hydroxy-6-hydroxymethyldihydropteridine diphosphokinase [Longimonas halophila]PEN06714.1 2-amino-4-hydroxy-6-hydroxymethyldihydropteridine diphosphokinase [Longimonas halophila]